MTGETFTVEVAGGRRLEVLTAGPDVGHVLVWLTGTPSGLVAFEPMVAAAAQRGLRTLMCARPGYGRSDPRPGRRVIDVAADVGAVLDELSVQEFVCAGWSGGGPHALACAAGLPGRCLAAASVAGVAPYLAEGIDWFAGMGPENIAEFGAAANGPLELEKFLEPAVAELATVQGAQVAEGLGGLISAADEAVLTGDFADYLASAFRAAVSSGVAGWRDDDMAFVADWGFTPAQAGAGAPVSIWQGGQDRMVPMSHGEWLAARIPGARSHMLEGEGHLTLPLSTFGNVLDELVELAGWPTGPTGNGRPLL
jgi:pimeloyl-ACP methyl ester carboxylesterase